MRKNKKRGGKVIEEIYQLEQRHKKGGGQEQELSQLLVIQRDELKEQLECEIRKIYEISRRKDTYGEIRTVGA